MNSWKDFQIGEKYYRHCRDKDGTYFICIGITLQKLPLLQSPKSDVAHLPQFFAGGYRPSDWAVFREPREWCVVVLLNGGGKTLWEDEAAARRYYNDAEHEYVTVREILK